MSVAEVVERRLPELRSHPKLRLTVSSLAASAFVFRQLRAVGEWQFSARRNCFLKKLDAAFELYIIRPSSALQRNAAAVKKTERVDFYGFFLAATAAVL